MNGNDYVKYITVQMTTYLDMSKLERKEQRLKRKKSQSQATFSNRWFGMVPFAMKMLWKKAN